MFQLQLLLKLLKMLKKADNSYLFQAFYVAEESITEKTDETHAGVATVQAMSALDFYGAPADMRIRGKGR